MILRLTAIGKHVVNLTLSGRLSGRLAKIFLTIGRTVIVTAKAKDG